MRILMDFVEEKKYDFYDVIEIEETSLILQGNESPYELFIDLFRIGKGVDFAISGQYKLDGTLDTYNKAITDYNNAVEKLFTKGYAKISDFGNVEWF